MGLFDRFKKPKWEHEDPKIRIEGIKELDDKEILIEMAKNDSDSSVRLEAVDKISDGSVLADIAKSDSDSKVRIAAINKISDKSVLADIAKNGKYDDLRKNALLKITDESILADIAKNDSDRNIRKAAVEKVNDESVLIDIVKTGKYDNIRCKAVSKISDESVLADIAINDEDVNVCVDAVENISDESLLADVAKNARPACFERAVKKINDKEILENIAIEHGDRFTSFNVDGVLSNINDESSLGRIAMGTSSDVVVEYVIPRIDDKDILENIYANALNDNARKLADDKVNKDTKCYNIADKLGFNLNSEFEQVIKDLNDFKKILDEETIDLIKDQLTYLPRYVGNIIEYNGFDYYTFDDFKDEILSSFNDQIQDKAELLIKVKNMWKLRFLNGRISDWNEHRIDMDSVAEHVCYDLDRARAETLMGNYDKAIEICRSWDNDLSSSAQKKNREKVNDEIKRIKKEQSK